MRPDKKPGKGLWICLTLTLLWILFVFLRSLQNGEASSQESGLLWEILATLIPRLSHTLVRKLGHLAEFTVLGSLLGGLFRLKSLPGGFMRLSPRVRHLLLPAYCGLVVAFCDEIIQTGVPGRDGRIMDVFIDFAGVCLGILLVAVWKKHRKGASRGQK